MARKTAALTVVRPIPMGGPRSITVKVPRPRAAPAHKPKRHHRRHHSGGGGFMTQVGYPGLAGLVLGYIDKGGIAVPTVPLLGRAGTLALAAWIFRKHHSTLPHMAGGFAAIALYELEREGSISGLATY